MEPHSEFTRQKAWHICILEDDMNMSWLSMIGGGITAAATLAVGISTSGIFAANPASEDSGLATGETIYVEQPVVEVPGTATLLAPASSDPIVIAILPATPASGTAVAPGSTSSDPSVSPDPSMSVPPDEDGDEYLDDEDGEYEDEYEGPEDGEYEGPEDGEGDDGYEDPEDGEVEGPEHGEGEDD